MDTFTPGSRAGDSTQSWLAAAGIFGPLWFTALVVVQGLLIPDYSHVRLPISALAAWPTGWIQTVNFYVFGTSIVAFAVALNRGIQRGRARDIGTALFLMSGLGVIASGIFPWHMVQGIPTETPAHVVGAITAFACLGFGAVVISYAMKPDVRWQDLAKYTRLTGVAALILFVTVGFFAVDDGAPFHPWAGLLQRVLCVVWFAWMIAVAFHLRRLARSLSSA
jgi:hypothetical membrane protein